MSRPALLATQGTTDSRRAGLVIGAAVGGLGGAIWADRNNDGMVDGYVYNGQYYTGGPAAAPAPAPAPTYSAPTRSGERG